MSNDNILTFYGQVGTKPDLREGSGIPWVMFRAASTPSYWDQASRSWRDLETIWLSVKAWKTLAMNAAESLEVGDPIVVVGKLRTQSWTTKEGEPKESSVLEATSIAHDLGRGVTTFRRVDRQPVVAAPSDGTAEALADLETGAVQAPAA